MNHVNAEATRSTKNAVVRRQFYFIAYNGSRLGEVGEFNPQKPIRITNVQ